MLDPNRQIDAGPRINGYFNAALSQVLVIRQLRVDSATFATGSQGGGVPIAFTITSRARIMTRAVSGENSILIDSSVVTGTLNLRWGGTLPNGDVVPAGNWTILVEAEGSGQNTFSASQPIRISSTNVDTIAHLTTLPGRSELPETVVPRSAEPLRTALILAGVTTMGELAFYNRNTTTTTKRQIGIAVSATFLAGVLAIFRPVPRPVPANVQYNSLLREELVQRNAEIARQNALLRRQAELTIVPVAKRTR
jgi:hypothetical protein